MILLLLYVATREERLRAYDRQGVPERCAPFSSHYLPLAEQMDVDYAVLGIVQLRWRPPYRDRAATRYAGAENSPSGTESAPLVTLQVSSLHSPGICAVIRPNFSIPKDQLYRQPYPPIRLDALENYVRGTLATTADEKIQRYREASG